MKDYTRSLKVHYKPFKGSPEVACLGVFLPIKTTRNFDKVTCKTCLNAKWYKKNQSYK